MELIHMVEVNDRIAMHPQKPSWVKDCLEVLHTLAKHVRLASHVEPNVLPQRLYPPDFVDAYKHDVLILFHDQSLHKLAVGHPRPTWLARSAACSSVRARTIRDLAKSSAVSKRSTSNGLTTMSTAMEANADNAAGS